MRSRVAAVLGVVVVIAGAAAGAIWWSHGGVPDSRQRAAGSTEAMVAESPDAEPANGDLPVPPFPSRIAEGEQYDQCMTMIAADPEGAEAIATSWQAKGGGDAAVHCQALAAIANGEPETGAAMLENLAHGDKAASLTRAVLLGQAAEARMMAEQANLAFKDTTEALAIAPDDPDLLIGRANAKDALDRPNEALDDLNRALTLDPARGDALVSRASVWRKMNRLAEARADIDRALALDSEDPDALLERGILRQAAGDLAGAREDWTHARNVDPNSEAAELAAQNLNLLDSGPARK
jgi:tetratricopeptide (TPR) repeat protein